MDFTKYNCPYCGQAFNDNDDVVVQVNFSSLHEYEYTSYPPYEILKNKFISFEEITKLKFVEEMVDMISATRSYEANTTAMDASKNMAMQAINIGS